MIILITGEVINFSDLLFKTSRSGGKGGQNVNKIESKVEVIFDFFNCATLSDFSKTTISKNLKNRINKENKLRLICESERSQISNRGIVIKRLQLLLNRALKPKILRKETKPSKVSIEKRLLIKRKTSEKKISRTNFNGLE